VAAFGWLSLVVSHDVEENYNRVKGSGGAAVDFIAFALFLPGVKESPSRAFCHDLICSKDRGDPHRDDGRHVPSSFEERQEILDHEVAGHVDHRSDNHQRKGEPHP
jgi:hypothetical protein